MWTRPSSRTRRPSSSTPKYASAHIGLGNSLRLKGRVDEAIAEWTSRKGAIGPVASGMAHWKSARRHIASVRTAVQWTPRTAQGIHYRLGIASESQGDLDEAIAAFEEVIRRKPDFTAAHFGLASALAQAKQWDRSASVYAAALKRFGAAQWPGPWYEAIRSDEVFTRLTAQQPDDRLPWIMRARLHVFERDWKRAAADYARVNDSCYQASTRPNSFPRPMTSSAMAACCSCWATAPAMSSFATDGRIASATPRLGGTSWRAPGRPALARLSARSRSSSGPRRPFRLAGLPGTFTS